MIFAEIEPTVLAVYIAMAVGFIVMVSGIKNLNKKSNARIIMAIGAIIVFGAVGASFFVSGGKSESARLEKNIRVFRLAKAEKAASYIFERFSQDCVVAFLIDMETSKSPDSVDAIVLSELQNRLKEKGVTCGEVLVVGETAVDKKTGEETREDPLDAGIMKKKLDQVYDNADIVVNFVGLPSSTADLKTISFLTKKNTSTGKNNMLLMNENGLPYVEQDMLKSGRVCAIIDHMSEARAAFNMQKDVAPKDLNEAFNLFFCLVCPETLESFIANDENYFITE